MFSYMEKVPSNFWDMIKIWNLLSQFFCKILVLLSEYVIDFNSSIMIDKDLLKCQCALLSNVI